MAIVVTIAGTPKSPQVGSLRISRTANGRSTASFAIKSLDGTYRPADQAEVIITEDGNRIFGGLLERPRERGLADGSSIGILTSFDASDFNSFADRVHVNETFAAGTTLKAILQTIITTYIGGFPVTLDAGQLDGPTMPELTYVYVKTSDVLNQLATLTADVGEPYVWRIDDFRVLKMYQPSTVPAPFDLIGEAIPEVMGDLEVETTRDQYANQIIVQMPPKEELNRVETWTGDGVTTVFQLQYVPYAHNGYVVGDFAIPLYETLGGVGDGATWTLDPSNNTLTRTSAPSVGADIRFNFNGTYAGLATATDFGEVATVGLWQRVIVVESIPNDTTAQALADAYLARALPVTKVIRYRTRETGVAPGQVQTVTITRRNLSTTAVITEVVIRDMIQGGTNILLREVTAVIDAAQTNLGRGFRDDYKTWFGDKAGVSSPVTTTAAAVNAGPGAPTLAVQFNRSGVFGGDAEFTYNETTNSLVCGGGGSSITAAEHESCVVFGYNCHIADP